MNLNSKTYAELCETFSRQVERKAHHPSTADIPKLIRMLRAKGDRTSTIAEYVCGNRGGFFKGDNFGCARHCLVAKRVHHENIGFYCTVDITSANIYYRCHGDECKGGWIKLGTL